MPLLVSEHIAAVPASAAMSPALMQRIGAEPESEADIVFFHSEKVNHSKVVSVVS
jgi:hypothetical protein